MIQKQIALNRLRLFSSAVAILLVFSLVGTAAPVTFGFTGVVTAVDAGLAAEFSLGEPVIGNYSFDSATPDAAPGDSSFGNYNNTITSFTATFGGDYIVTQGVDNDILVSDGPLPPNNWNDVYDAILTNPTASTVGGLTLKILILGLTDTGKAVFNSDSLPLTPPDLSEFESNDSLMLFGSPNQGMTFRLTSFTLVPEPSSLTFAGLGLSAMCCGRLRQREKLG